MEFAAFCKLPMEDLLQKISSTFAKISKSNLKTTNFSIVGISTLLVFLYEKVNENKFYSLVEIHYLCAKIKKVRVYRRRAHQPGAHAHTRENINNRLIRKWTVSKEVSIMSLTSELERD